MAKWFSHPDYDLTVMRRRGAEALLEHLDLLAQLVVSRGRSSHWNSSFPTEAAYRNAVSRLRKRGLIARRPRAGEAPTLELTAAGRQALTGISNPWTAWKAKWDGTWYLLIYDVPEKNRSYRNALRYLIQSLRMGQLQQSVWLSWKNIRPDFDDLQQGASVQDYAYLFQVRSVLGLSAEQLAMAAWPMDQANQMQTWYLREAQSCLKQVQADRLGAADQTSMARQDMMAYRLAMEKDPLLPRALWPSGYRGPDVYELHKQVQQAIARRL